MTAAISVSSLFSTQSPKLTALPPLSLYVHIPWCVKKCPYCDFNSHEIGKKGNALPEDEYVSALIRDLEMALPQIWGRPVSSVFLGGGTPSLLSAQAVDKILTHVRMLLPLELSTEITLEANPGTFEAQKFADFRAAGINRLSIGVQSFNPRHLQALGRIHDDKEAHHAIEIALKNFDNVNLDLMYALPDQTLEEARHDIAFACASGVQHISAYHLTLEPNTLFYRFPPTLPDDDLAAEMQLMIEQTVSSRGYANYETSAFAKPNYQSRHNLNYWQFGDYLGIGAGAHSKISFQHKIIRQMRYKQPRQYLTKILAKDGALGDPIQSEHEIQGEDRAFEFMMNALRLISGFQVESFQARTGLPITAIQQQLKEAEQRGLISWDHHCIMPSLTGRRFLNDLLQIFLPEKRKNCIQIND
ncbi:radical SAM family heme chaperone HemW [Nitrosomonas sp. Nm33]|uniref:radical SAM family heme chaperone HemW n=1 Tax=Nitrosomonas sp. Nm33 TaxID=133724 RepID=UPI000895BB1F|nr:radical SAM family heme chaperone HemW [Nitrosomonas sp. Nm33]SDX88888.1 oxygen-independent coproporphyrinogen-3 oxidase [Nitrosomonas sp. Nm33]